MPGKAWTGCSGRAQETCQSGGIPLPLCCHIPGSEAAAGRQRHWKAPPSSCRGLRTGSAAAQRRTWRAQKSEGGGCLYDYASHAIDLLGYLVGKPQLVGGTVMNQLFSRDVEDEVYSTQYFANGITGQLAVNWSDESYRKMYMKITLWGESGRMDVNRQEIQIYLREKAPAVEGLSQGWNMRYTTDLTQPVWYYLRGEEYSAQIAHFADAIRTGSRNTSSTFRSAVDVDLTLEAMVRNAAAKDALTAIGA